MKAKTVEGLLDHVRQLADDAQRQFVTDALLHGASADDIDALIREHQPDIEAWLVDVERLVVAAGAVRREW